MFLNTFNMIIVYFVTFMVRIHVVSCDDYLTPYTGKHGSMMTYEAIQKCHKVTSGSDQPHETFPSHQSSDKSSSPLYKYERFVAVLPSEGKGSRVIRGHYASVSNPLETLSVLEPNMTGGCQSHSLQTVAETAKQRNCILAVNAGLFDTKTGECHGNVISDGRLAFDSEGIQNAHFGLKEDGNIFVGYVSEEEVLSTSNRFLQLVGGVVWLVKNGTEYVDTSKAYECESTEETGPLDYFINVQSARTAIGHDAHGRVIIVQVDGKSGVDGMSLLEFQEFLLKLGLKNAINLDGGGSSTFVVNSTVVNYPYDNCEGQDSFTCARKVSTVLCVHYPDCKPENCNGNGECVRGVCKCLENWLPPDCEQLYCETKNCSGKGNCSAKGCFCQSGLFGKDCEKDCSQGFFGPNCMYQCHCLNGGLCDRVSGICECQAGYIGEKCEMRCQFGTFGNQCQNICNCENSCSCHAISGLCEHQELNNTYSECIVEKSKQEGLRRLDRTRRTYNVIIYVLSAFTFLMVVAVIIMLYFLFRPCRSKFRHTEQVVKFTKQFPFNDSSSEEEIPLKMYGEHNAGNSDF